MRENIQSSQLNRTQGQRPDQLTLAEDRTILAAERTFASWLRTGLAFLSIGLGLNRFLQGQVPSWGLHAIAAALILCAAASFGIAGWREHTMRGRLPKPEIHALPLVLTAGASSLLVVVSMLAEVMIWIGSPTTP